MRPYLIPYDEIFFTAKFGFLSRKTWEKYFSTKSRTRNSEIWKEFVERRFFAKHPSDRLPDVLVLGSQGLTVLEKLGREKVHVPHLNQMTHDEALAQIAVRMMQSKLIESYQTESELKRKYLNWIKTSREGREAKMPDLLVEAGAESKLSIAIELEISRKSFDRYCKALKSYSRQKASQAIIFVTDDPYVKKKILLAMNRVSFQINQKPVGFSLLSDWSNDPATASIDMLGYEMNFAQLATMLKDKTKNTSTVHRQSVDELKVG